MEISKKTFEAYEAVRSSGVTNMFDVKYVCMLAAISREEVLEIMKTYGQLMEKYPDVRKNG
jgi:hypothetical protein